MIEFSLQVLKFLCCAYVAAAGLQKFASPTPALISSIPNFFKSYWARIVRVFAMFEVFLGCGLMLGLGSLLFQQVSIVAFAAIVTSFGLVSIKENASCGCTGDSSPTSVKRFLVRNLVLFGSLVAAVSMTDEILPLLQSSDPSFVVLELLTVLAGMPTVVVLVWIAMQRFPNVPSITADR